MGKQRNKQATPATLTEATEATVEATEAATSTVEATEAVTAPVTPADAGAAALAAIAQAAQAATPAATTGKPANLLMQVHAGDPVTLGKRGVTQAAPATLNGVEWDALTASQRAQALRAAAAPAVAVAAGITVRSLKGSDAALWGRTSTNAVFNGRIAAVLAQHGGTAPLAAVLAVTDRAHYGYLLRRKVLAESKG